MRPMPSPPDGSRLGQRRDRAADLDPEGVVAGGEDRFDERLGLCRGVLVRRLVERNDGVGGRPVLRDLAGATIAERTGDPHHVGCGGDVGEDAGRALADHGRGEAVVGVENDLDGVAGPLRELGLQGLRGGLRLGAGLEIVLLGLSAERARECEGGRQRGDPQDDDETALSVAPVS